MAENEPASERDRRQFERWQSQENVELVHNDVRYAGTVENASAGGLAIKSAAPVAENDTVTITMCGLPDAPMTVVRRNEGVIALKFLDGPNYHFR